MASIRANRLLMSRVNEFVYEGRHVWAPIAKCAAKDIEAMLDAVGADLVTAEFRTHGNGKARERDRTMYARRLGKLSPRYVIGPFRPKIIDGNVMPTTFVATINRIGGSDGTCARSD